MKQGHLDEENTANRKCTNREIEVKADFKNELADLRWQLEEMEKALHEKEQDAINAAIFGKSLLEKNQDLQNYIENMTQKYVASLEEKQQEICGLHSRIEVHACTERWQQDEIANLHREIQNQRDKLNEKFEEVKRAEISVYKKQIETLNIEIDHFQCVEHELRERVLQLENLLRSHLDHTHMHSLSVSFETEENGTLQQDLLALRMDVTELKANNIDLSGQLKEVQQENEKLVNKLASSQTEIKDMECQISSYAKHLEQSRCEIMDLRAQLDVTKLESQGHSSKGNSLFSELEDRRLTVEKKMASLKVQYQVMKEKYELEKQQNKKYRMEIADALEMASRKQDEFTVQKLRWQLQEAHTELQALKSHLQKQDTTKGLNSNSLAAADLLTKVEDKDYVKYLLTVISNEKDNASKAQAELQGKTMQYLDMCNQNIELTFHKHRLESELKSTQASLIKTTVQMEELQIKYEPDKVKNSKMEKPVVEKIDVATTEGHEMYTVWASTSSGSNNFGKIRKSAGDKQAPRKASIGSIIQQSQKLKSTNKQVCRIISESYGNVQATGILSSINKTKKDEMQTFKSLVNFATTTGDEDQENADTISSCNFSPLARKVNIAHDVKVIDIDGKESMEALSVFPKSANCDSDQNKKQTAAYKRVKYIKCTNDDTSAKADCKTQ